MNNVCEINAITGETINREMNENELEQLAADKAEAEAEADALAARTAARVALLDKLGITADEAQLLLGGM